MFINKLPQQRQLSANLSNVSPLKQVCFSCLLVAYSDRLYVSDLPCAGSSLLELWCEIFHTIVDNRVILKETKSSDLS